MKRERFSSGTQWEPIVGYSRALKVGSVIHVSGTTATDEQGNVIAAGDPAGQAEQIIRNIRAALEALGSGIADVVRTRIYVCNIDDWEAIGRVHGKHFGENRPATSMVEVSRLIDPEMLLEIEAEAVIST